MDVEAFRTFITVVEGKSFTKAAVTLSISQPSVSLHIKHLEEVFGTKLIDRSPKYFNITPTGEIVYQRAKQMMGAMEKAKEEVSEYHNQLTGELTIGASYTVGEYILPSLLKEFDDSYPKVNLSVHIDNTENINRSVLAHTYDIGFVEGKVDSKELKAFSFLEDEMVMIAPPEHLLHRKKNVQFKDLHNLTWIGREEGSGTRDIMDATLRIYDVEVKKEITITSNHGVVQAVRQGLGVSFISKSIVQNQLGEELMVHLPYIQVPKRQFSCVVPAEGKLSKNVEVLVKTVKEQFSVT
ncbi:LysR family transcriptional regulator [Thalassobacillus pellis]|uniref:LysR family transcriptional regulator n=1 Tax=Thalassobacillus pellis TaxID=748008 RepID=UPI00196180AA|nr:LysR family transcriptional regulator [Thalassobacillus pellis]MBM7554225.1 DNA-binding transcriptional LysR family regulator [Thalassobacillus pellis]